ncbi:MAG: hypothetical protein RL226_1115, partial [Bacteroidota bacterium]
MEFTWTDFFSAAMVLFAVIDVVGSIPVLVDVKRKAGHINSLRATLVSMLIMFAFLFLGEKLITFLGIDVNSFAVAGSLVLFFLALEMVLGVEFFKHDPNVTKAASVVPVAFPIIAGAGSMTTIISLRAEYSQLVMSLAILANMIVVFIVLRLIYRIEKMLGE